MKIKSFLIETKNTEITVGSTFILSADLGKLKKGEKVKVTKKRPDGNDIRLYLTNEKGTTDVFYLDQNDNFEELI